MERVFAITSSSKTVTLDPQGRGRVTFTVTNTGSEPLTARCRVAAEEPAAEGWFEPLERPERRLEPEGTEQLTVSLAVPAGTAAGGYSFRLDATSAENPDEHHVEGQSVAFEVAPPPEKKSGFPWWILIVAAVLVAGLLAWLLWPSAPGLGESCDNDCAAGLLCEGDPLVCVGELGFTGCGDGGDCAAGLDCYPVEVGGETVSRCLGALGFAGCSEHNDCGVLLACDQGTCRGGPEFACSDSADCTTGYLCWGGTCKVDTTGVDCGSGQDCAPGQSCIEIGGKKKCMRNQGEVCEEDLQCASLSCVDGRCVQLAAGVACLDNAQCQSSWCDGGKCRTIGRCRSNDDCPSWMECAGRMGRDPRTGRQLLIGGSCKRRLGVAVPAFQNPNVLFEVETFRESRERELRHLAPGVVTPPPRQN